MVNELGQPYSTVRQTQRRNHDVAQYLLIVAFLAGEGYATDSYEEPCTTMPAEKLAFRW